MVFDPERIKDLQRKSNGKQRPTVEQKKDMPDWMSED